MTDYKRGAAAIMLSLSAVASAQPPAPVSPEDQAREERLARGRAVLRQILGRLDRAPSSLNIRCSYTAEQCAELRGLITFERLGNVRPCNRPDTIPCLELTFRHTGNFWSGTYLSAQVITASDFESPDDFTITLGSYSFVMD